jgi:exonuclease III
MAKFRIMTWNVNHFSSDNRYRGRKTQYLYEILMKHRPDVLIVQEVNGAAAPFEQGFRITIGNGNSSDVYTVHMGPLMKLVGSLNRTVDGTQYEYYPVLIRQNVSLDRMYAIMPGQAGDRTGRNASRTEHVVFDNLGPNSRLDWPHYRPILMYVMTINGTQFELGNVHTSPSWDPVLTGRDYVDALTILDQRDRSSSTRPVILGGDWYISADKMVLDWRKNQRKPFDTFLSEHGFAVTRLRSTRDRQYAWTNFPHSGDGQAADFFMAKGAKATKTNGCYPKHGKSYLDWKYNSKNARVSDHAPVYIDYDCSSHRSRSTSPMSIDSDSGLSSDPDPVISPPARPLAATRVLRRKRSDWFESLPKEPQSEPRKSKPKSRSKPRPTFNPQYTRLRVEGDGNCLFSSIALADGYRYGSSADRYRQHVVGHMQSNAAYYAARSGYDLLQFQTYLNQMARDGVWGTDLELEAFSNMLGRDINVHFDYTQNVERHAPVQAAQNTALHIMLVDSQIGLGHFDPLVPLQMPAGVIEEEDEDDY